MKAAACDREACRARGLSIPSIRDIAERVCSELRLDVLASSTVWTILHDAALKPWQYRSWIFPRDPDFLERAGRVLDLYAGFYEGEPLGAEDLILSMDEKPGVLLRTRCHPTQPPHEGSGGRVEFEYRRHGTLVLLAALEVRTGRVFHQIVEKNGIEPFQAFLKTTLEQPDCRGAKRVFVVVDNGSSHARTTFPARLKAAFPRADDPEVIPIALPTHASWLNQIEIFFSILARKALKQFECRLPEAMIEHIRRFIDQYNEAPAPFNWHFTTNDLIERMKRWPDPIPISKTDH